ncbi:MAG: hypothetical protein M3P06_24740 [Acidobacteriota bacterium]|nr:hypothetical protein [Acidobacteriota bacterium]
MRNSIIAIAAFAAISLTAPASASRASGCDLSVIVDGQSRSEYSHRGATYIEAIRGREYSLRLSNPTPYRVAVALAVDGLNTIDAKHTDGWNAAKWVLEPYETTEINGWQVNDRTARRFFFTGERHSYGAALGATENLGVIEAIFYREKRPAISRFRDGITGEEAPSAASPAPRSESAQQKAAADDDYAATGMGGRTRHDVERVNIDLESRPIASIRIRYEFRPELVKLGVFPKTRQPLERREKARGFEYCPEP